MYEMLSGQRAFRRETPAETMTAVLREDPAELSNPAQPAFSGARSESYGGAGKNPRSAFPICQGFVVCPLGVIGKRSAQLVSLPLLAKLRHGSGSSVLLAVLAVAG